MPSFKCPSCGAPASPLERKCSYCGAEFFVTSRQDFFDVEPEQGKRRTGPKKKAAPLCKGLTVTLQGMAEAYSEQGVPVFCVDVNGYLSGIATKGEFKDWLTGQRDDSDWPTARDLLNGFHPSGTADHLVEKFLRDRVRRGWDHPGVRSAFGPRFEMQIGYEVEFNSCPIIFWRVFSKKWDGSVWTPICWMEPLLLSRHLNLSEPQEVVLKMAFSIAEDEELPLIDLTDLQALLEYMLEYAHGLTRYGHFTKTLVGSIQRAVLALDQQGANRFLGPPSLAVYDLFRVAPNGRGYISVLLADELTESPHLYTNFLLFFLSQLFEELPEVSESGTPKLVLLFDQAHLLFRDAPKALLKSFERMVHLITSKGVEVYFVTKNPLAMPDTMSRRLSSRVIEARPVSGEYDEAEEHEVRWEHQGKVQLLTGSPHERLKKAMELKADALMEELLESGDIGLDKDETDSSRSENEDETDSSRSENEDDIDSSRSDGFWTSLGKAIVRAGVPMATRALENAIKRGTPGGIQRVKDEVSPRVEPSSVTGFWKVLGIGSKIASVLLILGILAILAWYARSI